MKRSKTQAERLFDIHERLKRFEYPNCGTLSTAWEVSRKTIQRDIEFLKYRLDAPIEYDYGYRGYYYSDNTFMLPAFPLSEGELISLLMAVSMLKEYEGTPIADKLMSVCRKLSEFLPETISVQPEELFSRFSVVAPPSRPITPEIWFPVVQGLLYRKTLEIEYARNEGRIFRVAPLHLANLQGDWYLFVRFEGYDNFRQLALSRMKRVSLLEESIPDSSPFNPEKELGNSFGKFAGDNKPFEVVLLFNGEAAERVIERQWHIHQDIKQLPNGVIKLKFPAKGLEDVLGWVLAWGSLCTVQEPLALRKMVQKEAEALENIYRIQP